ncbi:MAG: FGGY family carbohydrate kinase [Clostridiaceae bacterium]|nr:FGGY family carbohydrate kinase [Clostridiaceae bacterium]
MGFLTIDLGTTNIKVIAFSDNFRQLAVESAKVLYKHQDNRFEFSPEEYYDHLSAAIYRITLSFKEHFHQIILTGQAESLVVVDADGHSLRPGISWMDARSDYECEQIKQVFSEKSAYQITGQPVNTPTWPITKILWLKKHEPEVWTKAAKFMLLKDYILYRLTGKTVGELSIYNFTYYFDIQKKDYWDDMLSWAGINRRQLPELVEPCSNIGRLTEIVSRQLGLGRETTVNVGTLDHFAGMIGTGNIEEGIISESTGTVVSLATLIRRPLLSEAGLPCHYGPFPDTYVLLPVCESGGVSLEWFKENMAADLTYQEIDRMVGKRRNPADLIFLPYLTGTNSPDYNAGAKGVFYGIRLQHDRIDMALAVMEGVAYLLQRNLDALATIGVQAAKIITSGGGSKSDVWCQIKADLTGFSFAVPDQSEAASLGCALIGAVSEGIIQDFQQGVRQAVSMKKEFLPVNHTNYTDKLRLYQALYDSLLPVFALDVMLKRRS